MIYRFAKVTDGLFRGSAPNLEDVIDLYQNYKIRKIISLDQKSGDIINKICKRLNINHILIPINNTKNSLIGLLENDLYNLLISGGPTFVHCKHGKDRTGLVCALFSCKYLNKTPNQALEEAKKLDFGTGIKPETKIFYEKLINDCTPIDENHADIVSNQREFGDDRDSYLEEGFQHSFSPFMDQKKEYPFDFIYNDIYTQSPTRENYQNINKSIKDHDDNKKIPISGLINNISGDSAFGPTINMNGFIYD